MTCNRSSNSVTTVPLCDLSHVSRAHAPCGWGAALLRTEPYSDYSLCKFVFNVLPGALIPKHRSLPQSHLVT